jgi:hypothetical protein
MFIENFLIDKMYKCRCLIKEWKKKLASDFVKKIIGHIICAHENACLVDKFFALIGLQHSSSLESEMGRNRSNSSSIFSNSALRGY